MHKTLCAQHKAMKQTRDQMQCLQCTRGQRCRDKITWTSTPSTENLWKFINSHVTAVPTTGHRAKGAEARMGKRWPESRMRKRCLPCSVNVELVSRVKVSGRYRVTAWRSKHRSKSPLTVTNWISQSSWSSMVCNTKEMISVWDCRSSTYPDPSFSLNTCLCVSCKYVTLMCKQS